MPVSGAVEYLGGFLYNFVEDNNLDALEVCVGDADSLALQAFQVVEDFHNKDSVAALAEIKEIVSQLSDDLSDCKAMSTDVSAIKSWVSKFNSKSSLIAHVTKNFLFHKKAITADFAAEKAELNAGQYYAAGMTLADAATLALGPIEKKSTVGFPAVAIPDFVAGFIYGMTGDNDLTEITDCFHGSQSLYNEINNGINDIEKGGWDNIT